MLFIRVLFVLSSCATSALAIPEAAAYQALAHWNALQLDIEVNGFGQHTIAKGCVGGSGGEPDFDDLLRYLESPSNRPAWTGTSNVAPGEKSPDIESTVADLVKKGYNPFVDGVKLLPYSLNAGPPRPDFRAIYTSLGVQIEALYKKMPTDSTKARLDAIIKCINAVNECRQADVGPFKINDMGNFLRSKGFNIVKTKLVSPKYAMTIAPWKTIDVSDSIQANGIQGRTLKAFNSYVNTWGVKQAPGTKVNKKFQNFGAISHMDAIDACTSIVTRMNSCI